MGQLTKILSSFALPMLAGVLGSLATMNALPTWYAQLIKPWFTPANWLFGPVWTGLYLLMGVALYRVWSRNVASYNTERQSRAVMLFIIHLAVNTLWSVLFFSLRSPGLGLLTILVLLLMIIVLIKQFYRLDRLAGILLVPYVLWIAYATLLNAAIWYLN